MSEYQYRQQEPKPNNYNTWITVTIVVFWIVCLILWLT